MRIQHNIPAMNAYRNYNHNAAGLNKNLEKLSSGYKINRAGDDAAGLAISEKMRAQITGLEVANKNAKDGINVVQTAEGALTEVHDMLNRMYNLAEQSANGTYKTSERSKLQQEINQLNTEIDRIAESTNFNGLKLLDGSLEITVGGSKRVSVNGADRVMSSLIQSGERATDVVGMKTITDRFTASSQKAKFEVDLSEIKYKVYLQGAKASANGSIGMSAISLKIGDLVLDTVEGATAASAGGVKVTITNGSAQEVNASAVAEAIFKRACVTHGTTAEATKCIVTLNGVDWKMSLSSDKKKIEFEQMSKPETEEQARANFDVSIRFDDDAVDIKATMQTASANGTLKWNPTGALKAGTNVTQEGIPEGSDRKANTVIKITKDDIRDGAKIKLGNGTSAKTYVLKVGANSTVTAAGSKQVLVKLTDMEEDNVDLDKALSKISKEIGSSFTYKYSYRTDNGTICQATVSFNVGVSKGADGTVQGLAIARTTDLTNASTAGKHPAFFTSVESFKGVFSMKYDKRQGTQSGLKLQIGDTAEDWNQLSVSISDMHAEALGLSGVDITSAEGAADAMTKIMDAIELVSETRANLGAIQNRLDHTMNNLSVTRENLQDAEATIRDTDVAEEMMTYTKNSILNQAAQAMLAQANQQPQGVLQLLG